MSEADEIEDIEVARIVRQRRQARGLRVAARRAIALARRYRDEEGPRGAREEACIAQALKWRAAAREMRVVLPGLARARARELDAKSSRSA